MSDTGKLNQDWQAITIHFTYEDRGEEVTREVKLVRADVEKTEREQRGQGYKLTPEEFQRRVVENVEGILTSSVRLPGDTPDSIRLLPPWVVRQVVVTVDESTPPSRIVVPE